MVSTLKEESSDESTVISSQTSTLTRDQGPEDLDDHGEGADTLGRGMGAAMGMGLHGVLDDEDEEEEDLVSG